MSLPPIEETSNHSFLVYVTYDLKRQEPRVHVNVKNWIRKLGYVTSIQAPGLPARKLPNNTLVQLINANEIDTIALREEKQQEIVELLKRKGVRAVLFVVVARKRSWGFTDVRPPQP